MTTDSGVSSYLYASQAGSAPVNCATWLIVGISMLPTLRSGQRVEVCVADTLRRGDIVIVEFASRKVSLCKRIVGVPGDTLDGRLPVPKWVTWKKIPPQMYYVRSDNPKSRFDSRRFGLVGESQIRGAVLPYNK